MTLRHRRLAGAAPTTCSPRRNAIPGRPTSTGTRAGRSVSVFSPMHDTPSAVRPSRAADRPRARLARNPGSTAHPARVNNSPIAGRRSGGRFGARPPRGPRAAATHRGNMRWTGTARCTTAPAPKQRPSLARHRAEHGGQDYGTGEERASVDLPVPHTCPGSPDGRICSTVHAVHVGRASRITGSTKGSRHSTLRTMRGRVGGVHGFTAGQSHIVAHSKSSAVEPRCVRRNQLPILFRLSVRSAGWRSSSTICT